MKNICVVAGARPNFMKIAPLIRAIEATSEAKYELIYTGKEDDITIETSLFDDLQIPKPSAFLNVDSIKVNEITSQVMASFDCFLDSHPTDVVVVVDDLASTMAVAIVTKKRGIRLAHLVAGTRSFDIQMPKEINRLVIDALSDFLFTAGVKSNSVAVRTRGETSQTYMVGNILMDTLRFNYGRFQRPKLNVREKEYFVLTLNRKALLAEKDYLKNTLDAMVAVAGDIPVYAPLRHGASELVTSLNQKIKVVAPMSYLEFGWLTAHAKGVITDSGNVAEEATFNHVPCITLNNYTEHQETVTLGTNVLTGGNVDLLVKSMQQIIHNEWKQGALPDRWDGRTAERITKILIENI